MPSRPDASWVRARPDTACIIRRDITYEIDRDGGVDGLLIMDYSDERMCADVVVFDPERVRDKKLPYSAKGGQCDLWVL